MVQRRIVSSESRQTTQTTIPFVKDNEFDYSWLTGGIILQHRLPCTIPVQHHRPCVADLLICLLYTSLQPFVAELVSVLCAKQISGMVGDGILHARIFAEVRRDCFVAAVRVLLLRLTSFTVKRNGPLSRISCVA